MKKYTSGVTLIELIVVLIILSMTSLMTLQYGNLLRLNLQLDKTARQLRYFIFYYQNQALWLNENYLLRLDNFSNNQRIEIIKRQNSLTHSDVIDTFNVDDKNMHITISSAGKSKELYLSGKRGNNLAGHILLSNPSGGIKIIISNIGRIRLEKCGNSTVIC